MHDHPFAPVVSQWREKLRLASETKWKRFGEQAQQAMAFYNGPHDFLYEYSGPRKHGSLTVDHDSVPQPSFMMTVNKVAELVQLYGPVLYHKNPIRQVNARKAPALPIAMFGPPDDPMVQQAFLMANQQVEQLRSVDISRAEILQFYLNYTPNALGLKDHARAAIDEALIKGMGLLWTELHRPKGLDISLAGTFYDTVDNLVIDPDAESLREAKWIARRCIHPVWQVERDYGLPSGTIRGNLESLNRYAESLTEEDGEHLRRGGRTADLLVYWKIYSKMGLGGRLSGVPKSVREPLEQFGDFTYLVITDELPYPLNVPPEISESGDISRVTQAVQWPTPFWADDTWPFTSVAFHAQPRSPWPISHIAPAMGELQFLDWAYSFVASKIRISCRDFLAIQKSASEELKNIILTGRDYTLVEIEKHHGTISEVVQFLQHPQFNGSIWDVVQAIERNFEKRTGLSELVYGQSARQLRSASEAELKGENLKVRPDDMSARVEEAMTEVARKEALAARWHLTSKDVLPVMGPAGAQMWQQLLEASDPAEILYQLEYRIEAGSARKPNKDRDANNMQQAMQILFQPLFQYGMQTGNVDPVNRLLSDWSKSIDLDAEGYNLQPPPPPPPPEAMLPPEGIPAEGEPVPEAQMG